MIINYKDKRTQALANGEMVRPFHQITDQAQRRLSVLNAATCLDDLRVLRSNRLEMLRGDRKMQYSIRINKQWRICFEWSDGASGPSNVEIVDYH